MHLQCYGRDWSGLGREEKQNRAGDGKKVVDIRRNVYDDVRTIRCRDRAGGIVVSEEIEYYSSVSRSGCVGSGHASLPDAVGTVGHDYVGSVPSPDYFLMKLPDSRRVKLPDRHKHRAGGLRQLAPLAGIGSGKGDFQPRDAAKNRKKSTEKTGICDEQGYIMRSEGYGRGCCSRTPT